MTILSTLVLVQEQENWITWEGVLCVRKDSEEPEGSSLKSPDVRLTPVYTTGRRTHRDSSGTRGW